MQKNFNSLNPVVIDRSYNEALYILEHKSTIRQTAKCFGVCFKTTHNDLTKVLPFFYPELADKVQKHLNSNKKDSVFRAGRASAEKNKKLHKTKKKVA